MAEHERRISQLREHGAEPESLEVSRLPHLISSERPPKGPDREALALQINALLIAMREPGHEESESRILVTGLDEHRFDDLVDRKGRSCRKEAVETLLNCGFPHALKISPEDLEFARRWVPPLRFDEEELDQPGGWEHATRQARKKGMLLTAGAQAVFVVGLLIGQGGPVGFATPIALCAGVLATAGAFLFAVGRARDANQAAYGIGLGLLAVIQAGCIPVVGVPALIGAGGIAAGLLVSLGAQDHQGD